MDNEERVPAEILYAIMVAAMCDESADVYESGQVWYDEFDEK